MKIAVIGATGPTGQYVVSEGLEQGHEIIAVVRNPDKVTITHKNLKTVKAVLTDSSQLVEAFRGCDAVLSAIGTQGGMFTPVDIYTVIGKATLAAMKESGVKRLIFVTAWGTKDDPGLPIFWRWILRPTFLRHILSNMAEFEDYVVSDCSDITYTFVKPPYLKNWPSCNEPLQVTEGQVVKDYETTDISRQDVAKFMLSCLNTTDYDYKMMAITSRKKK